VTSRHLILLLAFISVAPPLRADDDLVATICTLLADKDKDVRALGLEQVREQAKGPAATRQFTALLPKLDDEAQVELLAALAERGDTTARAAVLERVKCDKPTVRAAAIRALGALGDKDDVPTLIALVSAASTRSDAIAAAVRLRGAEINPALADAAKDAAPGVRADLFRILVARHATDTVDMLLTAASDSDAAVRRAAFDALGQLAGPEQIPAMARLVLSAKTPASREEAEKAIMFVCQRGKNPDKGVPPLLDFFKQSSPVEQTVLLSTLGRVGGKLALPIVLAAVADTDPVRSKAGLKALCNWPDGSVAPQLYDAARNSTDAARRKIALEALIRVAPLPDRRPDAVRLDMLQKAMALATGKDPKTAILRRARAIRTMDSLHFVLPYMDDPTYAQIVAETVVELAHHKGLRHANAAEFNRVLDKAIRVSKDPRVIDKAKRYKEDRT
jgi:HEAT repeat protein